MKIEVLYFSGCPNHQRTVELVREVVKQQGLDAEIESVAVCDPTEAERIKFLGSPSIRIDGRDIEPLTREPTGHTLSCRLYGESGIPPRDLLVAALRAARCGTEAT